MKVIPLKNTSLTSSSSVVGLVLILVLKMMRVLALSLLCLLEIPLTFSASLLSLRAKEFNLGESLLDTTGGNITKFSTLTGTLLKGYYSFVKYSDATCSAVLFAESYPLNVCYPTNTGDSFKSFYNGTHLIEYAYNDYACSKLVNSYYTYSPTRDCDNFFRVVFLTASFPTIASSTTLLSAA